MTAAVIPPDKFQGAQGERNQLDSPPSFQLDITPHNSTNLSHLVRAIYVGTGGNVVAVMLDPTQDSPTEKACTYKNVPSGTYLMGRFLRVNATGTTATDLVGVL